MIKKLCDTCGADVPNFPAYRVEQLGVGIAVIHDFCSMKCVRQYAEKEVAVS